MTMATWRGLGQILPHDDRGVWPARIDCLAGKVTMRYGFRPGASRSAPVTPLRAAERGEHWWPVALAIIVVVGLQVLPGSTG